MFLNFYKVIMFLFCDMSFPWQFGFQEPATPVAEGIIRFHHDLMFLLLLIVFFVSWILFRICSRFFFINHNKVFHRVHGTQLEIVWTIVPAVLLLIIAIPSFALLYAVDELVTPALTLKVVGHQWYWSYEFSDYSLVSNENLLFDSYMLVDEDLSIGDLRLLEVDNRLVLPINTHVRLIITAADVLHCWTIPSFGVKLDACPGRLNQVSLFIKRKGVFFGQCSEICGVNHGFMPIVVESTDLQSFINWLSFKLESLYCF
jgi:cytochrome c oxidase subunit 2